MTGYMTGLTSLCSSIPIGIPWQKSGNTNRVSFDFLFLSAGEQVHRSYKKKIRKQFSLFPDSCGEGGIRTPGTSQYAGFQDRCNRPLCHLSKGFILSRNVVFPV